MATAACTITEYTSFSVKKIVFDWLSDTSGYVSDTAGTVTGRTTTNYYTGRILAAQFTPDTGDTQPDASYDVYLYAIDSAGTTYTLHPDLLNAGGENRSQTAAETKTQEDKLGAVCNEKLRLYVSGAGSANGGTLIVYIR